MVWRPNLDEALDRLPEPGPDPAPHDPFGQVMWENIGYLIDDERRLQLYREFETRIGPGPQAIVLADGDTLLDIARRGGMRPDVRVGRWREIAEITLHAAGGDLDQALRALPLPKARALLKRYPAIGDPGADKILLFAGISPRPALESNGVRALVRMGFVIEEKDYARTWRSAVEVLARQGPPEFDWLTRAYLTLRAHGRTTCKRGAALCLACPLDDSCAHASVLF
jgi:endonuclease-3